MKALSYLTIVVLLVLMSCSSGMYSGVEYDDLYFQASDQPVTRVKTPSGRQPQIAGLLQQHLCGRYPRIGRIC